MAVEDFLKGGKSKGFALGVGVALLAPVAVGVLATVGRPLLKSALKTGLLMYEKGMEKAAELGETLDDMVAEVRAEVDEELMAGAVGAETATAAQDESGAGQTGESAVQSDPGAGERRQSA